MKSYSAVYAHCDGVRFDCRSGIAPRAGQAIPVKFNLHCFQSMAICGRVSKWQEIACEATAPVDGVEQTAIADSSRLSYDGETGIYR